MQKRVAKEINDFKEKPIANIHFLSQAYSPETGYEMMAQIIGPADSIYAFVRFNIEVRLPKDYPFRPPKIKFLTKIYHPNVYPHNGTICCCTIPQLKDQWSPALTVPKILEMVVNMLGRPHQTLSDCGDQDIIRQFKNNYDEFARKAVEQAKQEGEKVDFD